MEEIKMDSMTKDEVIIELMELLKKNQMEKQAGEVYEMSAMVDMLSTKLDQMNQELVDMRMQIAKLTLQQVSPREGRGIKESLSEMVEKAQKRVDDLKERIGEIKHDIKEKASDVLDSAKEKGKIALDKLSNFFGVKDKLEKMRDKVKEGIAETDKSIAKANEIGQFLQDARQGYVNAAHALTGKNANSNNRVEQAIVNGIPLRKPWEWQKGVYERMVLHLDAAIDKVDNLSKDVEILQQKDFVEKLTKATEDKDHSYEADRAKSRGGGLDFYAGQQVIAVAEGKHPYAEGPQYGAEKFEEFMAAHKDDKNPDVAPVVKTEKKR